MQLTQRLGLGRVFSLVTGALAAVMLLSACGSEHPDLQPGGSGNPFPAASLNSTADVQQPAPGESSTLTVRMQLSKAAPEAGSVMVNTVSDTARAGVHYTAFEQRVSFDKGATSASFEIEILDGNGETEEVAFAVTLSNGTNVLLDQGTNISQTVTIMPNAATVYPEVSLTGPSDVTAPPFSSSERVISLQVELSEPAVSPATVKVESINSTARANIHYAPVNETLSFAAGEWLKTIDVEILHAPDETEVVSFEVIVASANNVDLGASTTLRHAITISPNDSGGFPQATITGPAEVKAPINNATRRVLTLQVELSDPATSPATLNLKSANSTAQSGVHFSEVDESVFFAEGEWLKTIDVSILYAPNETEEVSFNVAIASGDNVDLAGSDSLTHTIAILAPEPPAEPELAALSLPDTLSYRAPRAGRGTIDYPVVLTLDQAMTQDGSLTLRTVEGSAAAGVNFEAFETTFAVAQGDREIPFTLSLLEDPSQMENLEFQILAATAENLELPDERSITVEVINVNSESSLPTPTLSWTSVTELYEPRVDERTYNLLLPLSEPAPQAGSVTLKTEGATALAGEHFVAFEQTFDVLAGDTEVMLPVTLLRPAGGMAEPLEFYLQASQAVNLELPSARDFALTITPTEADVIPVADLQLPSIVEVPEPFQDVGSVTYTLWLHLSTPATEDGSVLVRTVDGTALSGRSYTAINSQTVNFSKGDEIVRVDVEVLFDAIGAAGKEFTLEFINAQGVKLPENRSMTVQIRASGVERPELQLPDEIVFKRPPAGVWKEVVIILPLDRPAILPGTLYTRVNEGTAVVNRDFVGVGTMFNFVKHQNELGIIFDIFGTGSGDREFTIVAIQGDNLVLPDSTEGRTIRVVIED